MGEPVHDCQTVFGFIAARDDEAGGGDEEVQKVSM